MSATSSETKAPTIQSRKDIDDILTAIEDHAEQLVEEARLDCSLSIGQVFEASERSDELLAHVHTLEGMVMLPVDLYEEVWSLIEDLQAEAEEDKAFAVQLVEAGATHLPRLLDRMAEYNIER
jgi:hypothetical protein